MAFEITRIKPYQKNTLHGFARDPLTNIGLEALEVTFHEMNGSAGYSSRLDPMRSMEKTLWSVILDFCVIARSEQCWKAALVVLDQFLSKGAPMAANFEVPKKPGIIATARARDSLVYGGPWDAGKKR